MGAVFDLLSNKIIIAGWSNEPETPFDLVSDAVRGQHGRAW